MSEQRQPDGYIDPTYPPPNPPRDGDAPVIIYGYIPTRIISILAIALFGIALVLHAFRVVRRGTRAFSILMVVGILLEIVGYVFRLKSSEPPFGNPYNVVNFVVQYFFIVVAPVMFSAAIYVVLTYLIVALGDQYRPFGLGKILILGLFVACDVASTIVQVAGAATIGSAESNRKDPKTGNNILLAGLVFQVFGFLAFLILLTVFILKARKAVSSRGAGGMMQFTAAIITAALLIYLRTIFRLAETAEGIGGFASRSQGLFGGLEFAPVVLAVFILGWWHPAKWIPQI